MFKRGHREEKYCVVDNTKHAKTGEGLTAAGLIPPRGAYTGLTALPAATD